VQLNAAGQVQPKLKTAWRDGTTHLVMSPLEFMYRQAALIPRTAALRRPIRGIECLERVGVCQPIRRAHGPELVIQIDDAGQQTFAADVPGQERKSTASGP
jgi:hypothetical protein